jgi:hypothetical protein
VRPDAFCDKIAQKCGPTHFFSNLMHVTKYPKYVGYFCNLQKTAQINQSPETSPNLVTLASRQKTALPGVDVMITIFSDFS